MSDPYKVLGLTRDASDDEIKKAYRTLSRKYHPDANLNNPNKDKAEEMFKLVQQAYEQIIYEKEHPWASAGRKDAFSGFYGNTGRTQSDSPDDGRLRAAMSYIQSGRFREALNALESVETRGAVWYYYRALANTGLGNNAAALSDAQTAVSMDPAEPVYRQFLTRLQSGAEWYTARRTYYGTPVNINTNCSRMCTFLCLSQMCCGGYAPLVFCC